MKSFAFFVAVFAATASARSVGDSIKAKLDFGNIKDEADKFSQNVREVLNGEGPTFTVDVSDHTLSSGVGERCGRDD